jgi:hypothetical protein
MGLASLGLDIGIFCNLLDSVLLNAVLGLGFLRPALFRPQVLLRDLRHRVRGSPRDSRTPDRGNIIKISVLGAQENIFNYCESLRKRLLCWAWMNI